MVEKYRPNPLAILPQVIEIRDSEEENEEVGSLSVQQAVDDEEKAPNVNFASQYEAL